MVKYFAPVIIVLLFSATTLFAQGAASPAQSGETTASDALKLFEGMINKTLDAYNAEDSKTFFSDFSSQVASITTEEDFKDLYLGMYKKYFGKFKTKEIIFDRTSGVYASSRIAIIGYSAAFEKNDAVLISAVFTKDGANWKLMNLAFHEKGAKDASKQPQPQGK